MKVNMPCKACSKERMIDNSKISFEKYLLRSPNCRKCAAKQPELRAKISKGWFNKERLQGNKFREGIEPWNKGVTGYIGGNSTSFKKGQIPWNKDKEHMRGKKHPNWKGGVTPLRTAIYHLPEYRKWRTSIFERDNYTCQMCNIRGGVELNADHYPIWFSDLKDKYKIRNTEDAIVCKELWDIDNGRTLCRKCHLTTFKRTEICVA